MITEAPLARRPSLPPPGRYRWDRFHQLLEILSVFPRSEVSQKRPQAEPTPNSTRRSRLQIFIEVGVEGNCPDNFANLRHVESILDVVSSRERNSRPLVFLFAVLALATVTGVMSCSSVPLTITMLFNMAKSPFRLSKIEVDGYDFRTPWPQIRRFANRLRASSTDDDFGGP